MRNRLKGKAVVITGASSGIGRATALECARRGANLILAARREEPLEELVQQCEKFGVQALAVPTDMTDPAQVHELARLAEVQFGRLDGWVNNAGVYLIGKLDETPIEDFQRVIDTNLMGAVYGTRAALPLFKKQKRGVFVNVASAFGKQAGPLVTAYAASKFALRGFSEALRQEVRDDGIQVSVVFPPSIDTPLWDHAANFAGKEVKPVKPVFSPERVARVIADNLERPKREVSIAAGKTFVLLHSLAPRVYEALMSRMTPREHFKQQPQPPTHGNLFEPVAKGTGTRQTGSRRRGIGRAVFVGLPAFVAAKAMQKARPALRRAFR